MKILHVSQPTTEGTAAVVLQLVQGALQQGHEVTVASPASGWLARESSALGACWVDLEMDRQPSRKDLTAAWRLRGAFPDHDIVHLHSSKAGALGRIARLTTRRKPAIVYTPHGWSWYVGGRASRFYRLFERWALGQTDAVVVLSDQELKDLTLLSSTAAAAKGTVIPNGIQPLNIPETPHAREFGKIVSVGRLAPQKGQDRLLRALAVVPDPSWHLWLIGDGPDRRELEDLAEALQISNRVTFTGTTNPMDHLTTAHAVVMASRWEGFSIAMLEAMQVGNLVIATQVGGTEALADCGWLIEQGDEQDTVDKLAAAIQKALNLPIPHLEELRKASTDIALGRYSLASTLRRHLDLYSELVN